VSAEIRITDGDGRFELHAQLCDIDRLDQRKNTFKLVLRPDGGAASFENYAFIEGAVSAGARPYSWFITGRITSVNMPAQLGAPFVAERGYFRAIYNVKNRKGFIEPGTWDCWG
jgi:hypothetical protein